MVTVTIRRFIREDHSCSDWQFSIPERWSLEGPTLRALLALMVRQEVLFFHQLSQPEQYLTEDQIRERAKIGKISLLTKKQPEEVDEAAEILKALDAFENGHFLVLINEKQIQSLEKEVHLVDGSTITLIPIRMVKGR